MSRLTTIVLTLLALLLWVAPATAETLNLSWTDNSDNEENFRIERTTATNVAACQTSSGFTEIATTAANVTTFADATLTDGLTYCYRVRASNQNGFSNYSNIAGASVPLGAPSNLIVAP